MPPAAIAENETIEAPVLATPGEVEGEVELDVQPQAESEAAAHVADEATTVDEDTGRTSDINEGIALVPVPVESKAAIAGPPSTVVEPAPSASYDPDTPDADESGTYLAPTSSAKTAESVDPDAEGGFTSPTTALGRNVMSLPEDEDDDNEDSARPPPPVVLQGHIPSVLRSQLNDEEEPEEDTWDAEVPPVRSSIPPPPPPSLPPRIEHERSETHTPVPPVATRPPVPAALASASPASPPLRPVPVPARSESPVPPPSRQGSISERPARRSMPPPPPPPRPILRSEEDEKEEVEQDDESAVGEGAHH